MKVLYSLLLICLSSVVCSQINLDLKDEQTSKWSLSERQKLNAADNYFNNQQFLYARPIYDSLYKKHKSYEET